MTATVIETGRLALRLFALADLEEIHSLVYSDPQVGPAWTGRIWSLEELRSPRGFLTRISRDRDEPGYLAVERAVDGRLLGLVGVESTEIDGEGRLVCAIGRSFWRRGYGLEACRAVTELAFDEYGYRRLTTPVDRANERGVRLLTRLGCRFEDAPAAVSEEQIAVLDAPTWAAGERGHRTRVSRHTGAGDSIG